MKRRLTLAAEYGESVRRTTRVDCRRSCSACCSHPVIVTLDEADEIYEFLRSRRLWTAELKTSLEQVSKLTAGLSFEVWLLAEIQCPLLDGNDLCTVYPKRPFQCAVTFSRDRRDCEPTVLGPGLIPKREILEKLEKLETDAGNYQNISTRLPLAAALLIADNRHSHES